MLKSFVARSSSCSESTESFAGFLTGERVIQLEAISARSPVYEFPTMDSQQLVDTASQNSQDIVLPKPASSTPRHSIDAILGLASHKRNHQEMEDTNRDAQENTGTTISLLLYYIDIISTNV